MPNWDEKKLTLNYNWQKHLAKKAMEPDEQGNFRPGAAEKMRGHVRNMREFQRKLKLIKRMKAANIRIIKEFANNPPDRPERPEREEFPSHQYTKVLKKHGWYHEHTTDIDGNRGHIWSHDKHPNHNVIIHSSPANTFSHIRTTEDKNNRLNVRKITNGQLPKHLDQHLERFHRQVNEEEKLSIAGECSNHLNSYKWYPKHEGVKSVYYGHRKFPDQLIQVKNEGWNHRKVTSASRLNDIQLKNGNDSRSLQRHLMTIHGTHSIRGIKEQSQSDVFRSDDNMSTRQPKGPRQYHVLTKTGRFGEKRARGYVKSALALNKGKSKSTQTQSALSAESVIYEDIVVKKRKGTRKGIQNKGWTSDPHITKTIIDMYNAGHSHDAISKHIKQKQYNVSKRIKVLRNAGHLGSKFRGNSRAVSPEEWEQHNSRNKQIEQFRKEGHSYGKIAKKLNISRSIVAGQIRRKEGKGVLKKLTKKQKPSKIKQEANLGVKPTIATRFDPDDWK